MNKVITLVAKEWSEVFRNKFVLFTVIFVPLIMTSIPLVMLKALSSPEGLAEIGLTDSM